MLPSSVCERFCFCQLELTGHNRGSHLFLLSNSHLGEAFGGSRNDVGGKTDSFSIPTCERLVKDDPKCAEIIKPYLRGQDIERWWSPPSGLHMIVLKSSGDHAWPWAMHPTRPKLSLSETYALKYWWCSPPRTGSASVRPIVWTPRGIGASLCSDRCVRASL